MTVAELRDFLNQYPDNAEVRVLQAGDGFDEVRWRVFRGSWDCYYHERDNVLELGEDV